MPAGFVSSVATVACSAGGSGSAAICAGTAATGKAPEAIAAPSCCAAPTAATTPIAAAAFSA